MLKVVKIPANELQVGMYVSRLDRPWLETPFATQGFVLRSDSDIERLREFCQHVYIDTLKSTQAPEPRVPVAPAITSARPRRSMREFFPQRRLKPYQDNSEWTEEYPKAQQAVEFLSEGINEIFERVTEGRAIDAVRAKKSVDPMIDSITRNPDACIWLARMKQEDQYTYQHSLGASIWAVALGRQLGLPRADLRSLAIGGLMFDVGKLRVDPDILNTDRPLSDAEFQQVRDHVKHGVEMIHGSGLMNQDVIDMVAFHHERHDGTGYPEGRKGDEIPVFARIAAIVDCYDAITSHRSYARAVSPSQAIKMLYEWKDSDFQAELVEEFIQAIGIYPAGSLVELSSGEVAVVVAEYRTRRLRPKVMVLLDAQKKPLTSFKTIDLLNEKFADDGMALEIVNSLEPDAYGIDMAAIQL